MAENPLAVLACFGDSPVAKRLEALAGGTVSLVSLEDRRLVHQLVCVRRPEFLLLPLLDERGVTTLPIIESVVRDAPSTMTVVCVPPGSPTHGLAQALQLHANLLTWSSELDMTHSVRALLTPTTLSDADQRAIEAVLQGLEPATMVPLLVQCAALAHQRLNVGTLAGALGMSRRTLNRTTRRAGWPTPSELIAWGRVLRASAVRLRGAENEGQIARAAGFRSRESLAVALQHRLGAEATLEDLGLMRLGRALRTSVTASQRSARVELDA